MKIIRAEVLGFCFGVRRAVETARNALAENADRKKNIFTLGPLVHNPIVMDAFQRDGIRVLEEDDFSSIDENSVVIIRAHGTTPSVYSRLVENNASVLDATCPKVHLSQKRAEEWSEKGYRIVIAGDKNHGEVISISSYANGNFCVIENTEEAENLDASGNIVLIAQTTFSPEEFDRIQKILLEKNDKVVVFNSICSATMERQNALKSLKGKADGIIVIGGRNSANTRRLYESACAICSKTVLIENEKEIPEEFLKLDTIAITAGASTPDSVIDQVELFLKK